jgi:epoxyqueuosine reductase
MNTEELGNFAGRLTEFIKASGACAVGFCNAETLKGGPPSTDLTREMASAKTAIVFAFPQDHKLIESYMGKIDHDSYQRHYIQVNTMTVGVAAEVAHLCRGQGFDAMPVHAGNTPSGGDNRDVSPQNEMQEKAAERYPTTDVDMFIGTIPVLSQRFLAAASGVGFFGRSGSILTADEGATVVLGAVVTSAEFAPTPPLPEEDNYCDECNWCEAVCPTKYMSTTENNFVELGERTHKYSKRMNPIRCGLHMGGVAGMAYNDRFSSWGPTRKKLPENDEDLFVKVMELTDDLEQRPEVAGGFIPAFNPAGKMNIMCSACSLVCHPKREVRARRVKMWTQGGVVVQHEDGRLEAMPREDAAAFVAAMPEERRALYDEVTTQ